MTSGKSVDGEKGRGEEAETPGLLGLGLACSGVKVCFGSRRAGLQRLTENSCPHTYLINMY